MSTIPSENVIFARRSGQSGDEFIHYSNEEVMIKENQVLLKEIPDFFQKVSVSGEGVTWVEIFDTTAVLTANQYRVNYNWGIIDFNSTRNGLTLSFDYYGTGCFYLPIARLWSKETSGTVTETLEDIIVGGQEALTALTEVNEFIVMEVYDNSKTYKPLNKVSYLGSTYQCILTSTGNLPTNSTYWILCSSKGDKGDQGIQGIQGEQGIQGIKGDTGSQGIQGVQGLKGDKGDQGEQGIQGVQGIQGEKGDTGATGSQGIQGVKGDTGEKGDKGDKGDTGSQGEQGIQGIQGLKGLNWKGIYNSETTYVVDDAVQYSGASYICILQSLNNIPTNTTYFSILAAKGTVDNVTWSDVQNKPSSIVTDIDDAVNKKHAHNNQTVLDNTTASFTTTEETKLSGIEANANNYTHPTNHPASIITQDSSNRFVSDAEKAAWNAKVNNSTTYQILLNSTTGVLEVWG